ncbi:mucin-22-like isoform X3 [Notothenia coriiceps]|uniref:Mucin-22-like isoform X3 n=1 Tax=Notothenia coriiceps TaxID=8208 RepID=A0A6I9NY48_9TELE|nr:PREDICTED: mucin-22-like isoform X3 [Notothenia coriiceps]
MHAPKRGSSPDDSQCKIRKLDQDEDDMQSTTAPATNNTAADSRNIPAKSSIQSSPPKDSSKTISEPPLKESKLLNATSASCGEAPSQKANSNASLKRTASTESEDELSSDSSKTDPFRQRHDGDKARCIRKYSNRVKAKRKAEEPTSDPQETGQGSPSAPEGPVQMDHNYGRFSDSSMGELDMDQKKESAHSVTELQVQVMSVNATQAESKYSLVAASRSAKASIEFECPDDQIKHEELKNVEGQMLNDNKTPTSCIESLDPVTATAKGSPCITSEAERIEKKDINNQKCVDNETVAPAVETLYSTGEANPACEVEIQLEESMNSFPKSPTVNISETETKDTTESVSKETLDVKCKSEDEGQEANVSADYIDVVDKALSNETNMEGGVNPESQTNKKLTLPTGNPDTQTDLSVKIQVTFKEESNIIHHVSHEVPGAITNSCEDVEKLVRKSEEKRKESDRKGVEFLSTQTVAVSASFAEVQVMEKTTDSCTEILTSNCEAVPEQNQNKVLSECVTDLKGHIDTDLETKMTEDRNKSAPKEDTLNGGNHIGNGNTTQIPAVVKEVVETRIEKENDFEDISNEAATMEIQIQKRQEVSEHTADISTELNKDCVSNSKIMENHGNQDFECTSGRERQTTTASQILNPASSVEVQIQERPRDDEPIAEMSDKTQKHPVAICQKAEGRVDAEALAAAENLNRIEVDIQTTTTASEETSNIAPTPTVDVQTTTASEETSNIAPTVDMQTTTASEETSNIAPTPTVDMQTTTASEETSNIAPTVDMQTTTASEETSNIAPTPTVDMQTTQHQKRRLTLHLLLQWMCRQQQHQKRRLTLHLQWICKTRKSLNPPQTCLLNCMRIKRLNIWKIQLL